MSTNSISDIRKQLASLEKQEARLLKKNRTAALKEIKALITKHNLTPAEVVSVLPKARRGRKPGSVGMKRGPKPKAAGVVAKAPSGKRRGRPPKASVASTSPGVSSAPKRRGRPPKARAAE